MCNTSAALQAGGRLEYAPPSQRVRLAEAGLANLAQEGTRLLGAGATQLRNSDCVAAVASVFASQLGHHREALNAIASQALDILASARSGSGSGSGSGSLTDKQAQELDQLNDRANGILAALRHDLDGFWRAQWERGRDDDIIPGAATAAAAIPIRVGVT